MTTAQFLTGHVIDVLRTLPDEHVQCIVTSPPYWGLRVYGTDPQVWGGDPECSHDWVEHVGKVMSGGQGEASAIQVFNPGSQSAQQVITRATCIECGAWRGELGHEETPQLYVRHLMLVFREARRVLRHDGVLFVNLGDSYAGSGRGPQSERGLSKEKSGVGKATGGPQRLKGIPPKSLCLIPERFVLAMQEDGWYVRSRIAWCKLAPMPESVRDRPTNAWEPIYMFTKSPHYYWDENGSKESAATETPNGLRNMWSYWVIGRKGSVTGHPAAFPTDVPRRCILAATKAGDVVMDPFSGSGATCTAAGALGRIAIGIDINPQYNADASAMLHSATRL